MRSLEEVIIDTLLEFNIKAVRKDRLTGVWYKEKTVVPFWFKKQESAKCTKH